jgi:hypothetical protein
MSYHKEEISTKKRPSQEEASSDLTDEDILDNFKDDQEFAQLLIESNHLFEKQRQAELKEELGIFATTTPLKEDLMGWKTELQQKVANVKSIEELDLLTKEFVKKNRPRKLPKKKLVRVENFYLRHTSGLQWMNNFINRTKSDAISRPYVVRMLELENEFKKKIEEDELLGSQLKE